MAEYKLTNAAMILRTSDGASIPPDPANTDYAAYLAWVEAGNTPDPVDPPSKEELNDPILAQLDAIDAKSIRALREGDAARVADLEAQAAALRSQLVTP